MRYKSEGEIHKDFHGLTCATLHYLVYNFGEEAMVEVLKNTAQKVYKTIRDELIAGKCDELIEYWDYYLKREGGDFAVEKLVDGVRIVVRDCPALRHLVKLEQEPDAILCEATRIFNESLAEGTAFTADVQKTGIFSCVQSFRRKEAAQ